MRRRSRRRSTASERCSQASQTASRTTTTARTTTAVERDCESRGIRGGAYGVGYPRLSVAKKHRVRTRSRRAVEAASLDVSVPKRTRTGAKAAGVVERTVAATISVGVAEPHTRGADPFAVLRDAERALEGARQTGMNRIVVQPRADTTTDAQVG